MRLISNRTLVIVLLLGHVVLVSSKQEYSSRKLLQESLHSWLKGAHSTIFGSRAKDPDDFIAAAGTPSVNGPDLLGNTKERTFGDGFLIKSHPHMSSFATFDSTPDVLGAGHTQVVDAEAVKDAGRSAAAEIANTAVAGDKRVGEVVSELSGPSSKFKTANCQAVSREYDTCVQTHGKASRQGIDGVCVEITKAYTLCKGNDALLPNDSFVVQATHPCTKIDERFTLCMKGREKNERYSKCKKEFDEHRNCRKEPVGEMYDAQKKYNVKTKQHEHSLA